MRRMTLWAAVCAGVAGTAAGAWAQSEGAQPAPMRVQPMQVTPNRGASSGLAPVRQLQTAPVRTVAPGPRVNPNEGWGEFPFGGPRFGFPQTWAPTRDSWGFPQTWAPKSRFQAEREERARGEAGARPPAARPKGPRLQSEAITGRLDNRGVGISASVDDERLRLRAAVGADRIFTGRGGSTLVNGGMGVNSGDWWLRSARLWGYYDDVCGTGVIGGDTMATVDAPVSWTAGTEDAPRVLAAEPAPALTAPERADELFKAGSVRAAQETLREHLASHADDALATRTYGVSKLLTNQLRDGVAIIAMAYHDHPELVATPINRALLDAGASSASDITGRVVRFAHSTRSASAFFVAAVLMQSQGRDGVARTLLERARAQGLDEELADRFQASLGG